MLRLEILNYARGIDSLKRANEIASNNVYDIGGQTIYETYNIPYID